MRESAFQTILLAGISAAILISGQTAFAEPNLLSYWKFDEGSGSTAYDSAGSNNGAITGASWSTDPCRGMCLSFDGSGDYVMIGDKDNLEQKKFTLSFWAKLNNPSGNLQGGIAKGYIFGNATEYSYKLDFSSGNANASVTNTSDTGFGITSPIVDSSWHMWSMTVGSGKLTLYKDGAFVNSTGYTGTIGYTKSHNNFIIGARDKGDFAFNGKIDDVRFYSWPLSADEIWQIFEYGDFYQAHNPNPTNGATGVDPNIVLSWSPGIYAFSHDVYFGTGYSDVNNANTSSPEYKGNRNINNWNPCGLDIETTYYWRIDEVNEPNVWKGSVWSFRTVYYLYVPSEYPTIQSAIDTALDGDVVIVAPGIYTGNGNRDIDFLGKAITVQSTDSNDPNIIATTIIDCNSTKANPHRGFNFIRSEDANSVLAGFTITNASNAIGCSRSSPKITNCIITKNTSSASGAIYCYGHSSPIITNCTITSNTGSGIHCEYGTPIVADCIISGNTGFGRSGDGGGISVLNGLCLIYNSVINGNTSGNGRGGGIYCEGSNQVIPIGCTITGNSAKYDGGGIYVTGSLKVANCTISGNLAKRNGGGIFSSSMSITDSIIWGNVDSSGTGQSAQVYDGKPDVWFSCIQDDNPDDANIPFGADKYNIDDDPCFVAPGFWDTNGLWYDGDYHLLPASPCIEAGNPFFTYHAGDVDMDGQPRLMGRCVDMGADEFEIKIIAVSKPKGGEVWTGGSTHEIKWDSYNINGMVDIYYSTNNGADWVKIESAANTGSYIWDLPGSQSQRPYTGAGQVQSFCHKPPVDSNQCRILVEPNTPIPNLIIIKSELFTIQPYRKRPCQLPSGMAKPTWWSGCPHKRFGPKYGCVKWQFQTGGPVTAGVAIGYNNRIHVPCEDGKLYTLNAGGKLLWTYDANSPLVVTPAVDCSGAVYFGAENGKLYAIDRDGRLLWTHTTDGPIYSSPVVLFDDPSPALGWGYPYRKMCFPHWHYGPWEQPEQIFVCSVDGTLYALGQDGSELWGFETDSISAITAGAITSSPTPPLWAPLVPLGVTTGAIFASPAVDHEGNLHIAGIYDPNLYAIDSNSVSEKWSCNFSNLNPAGRRPWPFASPVIAKDGTIYQALLYDANLYAIDPNDGSIIWSTNMADPCSGWFEPNYTANYGRPSCWSKPALAPDGTIYVSFNDPYLRAIDPNGNIKWVTRLGTMGGFTITVGGDGLIYAACDDARLYVVEPNGKQIAQFEGFGGLSFPTITAGRTIIVSDANNTVWAIGGYFCKDRPFALHKLEDLTGDGIVDSADLTVLTADWLGCTDPTLPCNYRGNQRYLKGDLNQDLYVDFADFVQLANRWLNKE
jgi:parallel beta-helix repeat protein/predicted outer membrane repeat protein